MNRKHIAALLAAASLFTLTACGASGTSDQADTGDTAAAEVRTVKVGTRGTIYPYSYLDENNNLTGYDIELLRLVDEALPDVTFDFQTMDLSACFVAVDAGQLDMVANQLVHNEERDSKYAFTTEPYCYAYSRIVVRGDVNDIETLEDLQGKTVADTSTGESAAFVRKFNETADPKIEQKLFDTGSVDVLNQVATSQVDAGFAYKSTVERAVTENGYNIKVVGEPITAVPTYFILAQTEENQSLIQDIDRVVQELKQDGTLSQLSSQFIGEDDTEPVE